jgi:ferredoxin
VSRTRGTQGSGVREQSEDRASGWGCSSGTSPCPAGALLYHGRETGKKILSVENQGHAGERCQRAVRGQGLGLGLQQWDLPLSCWSPAVPWARNRKKKILSVENQGHAGERCQRAVRGQGLGLGCSSGTSPCPAGALLYHGHNFFPALPGAREIWRLDYWFIAEEGCLRVGTTVRLEVKVMEV